MHIRERKIDFAWVAICCIAAFVLKVWANATRVNPGHGDTNYYFHVAENLYNGRGFVCDYVWNFLENPSGVTPAPSNAWWMPGPSIISVVGMWFAGAATYAAAQMAMIFVTSLFPAVTWWTAIAITKNRMLAARAALLAVAFHLFIDQPSNPLSHGPYGLIVAAALVLISTGTLTITRGWILGVLIALGHYFRGDALTLFGTAGILLLFRMRREGWKHSWKPFACAIAAYVIVMSPWFIRNFTIFGAPLPPGPGKALYMRDYYDWFALPDRLNSTRFMSGGVGLVVSEKFNEVKDSLWGYVASYFDPTLPDVGGTMAQSFNSLMIWIQNPYHTFSGGEPPPWMFLRHLSVWMSFITFAGLAILIIGSLRKKTGTVWVGVFALHSIAEIVFYAILFTAVSNQSYISSMYALYPLFIVGMVALFDPLGALGIQMSKPLFLVSGALAWILTIGLAAGNALGVGAYCRSKKGPEYSQLFANIKEFGKKLREHGFNPQTDKAMLIYTWNFYSADKIPCVRIPDEPMGRILETAKRMNVTWLVVGDHPGYMSRPYRQEVYEALNKPEYFWRKFDFPALQLHALKIGQNALDNPWKVMRDK
ncbi:MAG: hypothetical protein ACKVS6_02420 [Planctomycetota bacterium]